MQSIRAGGMQTASALLGAMAIISLINGFIIPLSFGRLPDLLAVYNSAFQPLWDLFKKLFNIDINALTRALLSSTIVIYVAFSLRSKTEYARIGPTLALALALLITTIVSIVMYIVFISIFEISTSKFVNLFFEVGLPLFSATFIAISLLALVFTPAVLFLNMFNKNMHKKQEIIDGARDQARIIFQIVFTVSIILGFGAVL